MEPIFLSIIFAEWGLCFGFFSPLGEKKDLPVAVFNALLWGLCAAQFYAEIHIAAIYALSSSVLFSVALFDLRTKHIPDRLQIYLLILGMGATFGDGKGYASHINGLVFAGLSCLFFYWLFLLFLQKEGIGLGDVKLMTCAGLLLGAGKFCFALVVAVICAAVGLSSEWIAKKIHNDKAEEDFAFAPYLATGITAAMLFGDAVYNAFFTGLFG